MNIGQMKKEDIDEVCRLGTGREEFATPSGNFWTKGQLERWCESLDDVLLIAEDDGKIVGFSFYAAHIPTGKVTWENLYVDPSARGKGIGKALIEEGHKRLKEKGYSYIALLDNSSAQERFAEYLNQFGFKTGYKVLWIDQFL
jgi:GNAT superfamily N-acetyltransferase